MSEEKRKITSDEYPGGALADGEIRAEFPKAFASAPQVRAVPDPITPALTPEEWNTPHSEWGMRPTKEVVAELAATYLPDRPHAAAALLLMGAGRDVHFTWNDVDELLSCASMDEDNARGHISPSFVSPVRSIAGRIAALLPPRDGR